MYVQQEVYHVAAVHIYLVTFFFAPATGGVNVVPVHLQTSAVDPRSQHGRQLESRQGVHGHIAGLSVNGLAQAVLAVVVGVSQQFAGHGRSAVGVKSGVELTVLVEVDVKV